MAALDIFTEKRMKESGFDSTTRRTLSSEAEELEKEQALAPTLSSQDKLGLAAVSFMVGPLGFIGLGALFSICDELDFQKRISYLRNLFKNNQEAAHAIAFRAAMGREVPKVSNVIPIDIQKAPAEQQKKRKREFDTKEKIVAFEKRSKRPYYSDNKELSRLVKRKEFLTVQIKRLSQWQDYHAVCKLASEVELLDKAIRRLGY